MFHLAIMWIIGAIIAAADLFGTMIGLAEVWIKGAISTAVIFFVFAAPYLVVRQVKRLVRRGRAVKEFNPTSTVLSNFVDEDRRNAEGVIKPHRMWC